MLDYSTIPQRILNKFYVDIPTGCWLWTAATVSNLPRKSYGSVWWAGRIRLAHRVMYELCVGPIPPGLQIDHLCRVSRCVYPVHLEPVTNAENVRRGMSGILQRLLQTHCKRGHKLSGANLIPHPKGLRRCRICANQRNRVTRPLLRIKAKQQGMCSTCRRYEPAFDRVNCTKCLIKQNAYDARRRSRC